ncbi:hypothetical protein [Haloarcula mannanilytica]|nr:hypothetical protein [Haloarcula mannanilytica]
MGKRPQRVRARLWAWAYAVVFEPGEGATGESTNGKPAASGGGGTNSPE